MGITVSYDHGAVEKALVAVRRLIRVAVRVLVHPETLWSNLRPLWDVIQKFDGKLQHLTHLVEKLGENASRREIRVAEISTPPQFLRLKEVMARVGLRVTTIYRFVAHGAFIVMGDGGGE
jgi:hypothetical protein